jgi:DNA-binding NtrC family response regulator
MNILILNDEQYLSQKVSSKLNDLGYNCELYSDIDSIKNKYEIILLSTDLKDVNYVKFIKKHKESIIILLASFLSDETVNTPISAGAIDYIIKPFSMDELIRKIEHFKAFRKLKNENNLLKEQNNFLFRKVEESVVKYSFPLLITSNNTIGADKLAFDISKKENKELKTIILEQDKDFIYNNELHNNYILYFCGLCNLNESQKEKFFESMKDKKIMIYQDTCSQVDGFECIIVKDSKQILDEQDIMSINDYVKYIVVNFQDKFPDTKLSEKLGISRKSLWEKRKKLNLEKKK